MDYLKNFSIRTKLLIISLIPLLALAYLLQDTLQSELDRKRVMLQVHREFEEVTLISALVHELQRERGFVLTYRFTDSEEDRNKMFEQRALTDKQINALQNIYRQHQKSPPILAMLDSIQYQRENLTSYPEELNVVKASLLREIHALCRFSQNPDIKNRLETHLYLLYAKEYLARIRSILAPCILSKEFKGNDFARFASRKGQYEMNREKFKEISSPELKDFFNKRFSQAAVETVHSHIDSLYYNAAFLPHIDHDLWWLNSSIAVNALSEVEDFSLNVIKDRAETELAAINRGVWMSVGFALVVILVITLLVFFTVRHIVSTIRNIKLAAERITQGDADFSVAEDSKDEIGELASSFNKMIRVTKQYAQVAETIGQGDYSPVVEVRGGSDTLGIALNNMKTNLKRLADENARRTWLLVGNDTLNNTMRGDKDLVNLTQDIIDSLTKYVKAQIGTLYIRENGHLKFAGGYSWDTANTKRVLQLGEGLVGQTALSAKPILLNNIPADYIKVNSALGDRVPRNLIVFPFLYENEVKGVIELGSLYEFSDVDLEFLHIVAVNIGIAINAAQARAQLKQLLEETQRQAEELESQQEELKQFNEELQEKTELLERSEEELKTQQEELQQTNEELEEKANLLEDQKQALEFAKFQIEEKVNELEVISKYKTDFLANMSHELRTPLNSILILSQVMMENRNNTRSAKEMELVKSIYYSGNDLLNLINEILDLSKIEAGKMEIEVTEFPVGDMRKSLQSVFQEVARNKSIDFTIAIQEGIENTRVKSDKQRIEQIIKNFLSNAFKFTGRNGKVRLKIGAADPGTIFRSKRLNRTKDIIAFTVSDTGIGIPAEKMEVIFEAFQQVDGSTKRKYGGTGLGLSISRELAFMLGGEIHVASELGAGSAFTLYLPTHLQEDVTQLDLPHKDELKSSASTTFAKGLDVATETEIEDDLKTIKETDRKILIIEDDIQFSYALLRFVREREYKGIVAHDGSTGLRYASLYKPDAILLDMKLPGIGGTHVLRQLKADPALRHIPVQIISGYDYSKEGLQQGALDYIKKPVTRETVSEVLDKVEAFVARKPKKLLIIEDDAQHNLAVKELIGNGDVSCYSAFSGKEGFDMLKKDSYDCVIVDMGLPDMSGFQFLEKIKEDQSFRRIPIIVYTGKSLSKEEIDKLDVLANTVVLKTAQSHERLLDETTLFLHRVESKLPKEKQKIIRKLHKADEVLKNKKVLIADDDVRNINSLVVVLQQEGVVCVTAENGRLAVEALKKDPSIDMVLMDVMMPEMDGYEATREIRKLAAFKTIPIIALTAKAMKGDREKCLEAGMSDYVSKPLNIQQLLSLMRVWLYV